MMPSSTTFSSSSRSVQLAHPSGGAEQASAVSLACFSPSKIGCIALAAQDRLKPFFHPVLADPGNHGGVGVERFYDLAVVPRLASFPGISNIRAFNNRLAGLLPC